MSSEVARLREQIAATCDAMHQALNGYAITASHTIINAKYRQLEEQQASLARLVGEAEACNIVSQTMDQSHAAHQVQTKKEPDTTTEAENGQDIATDEERAAPTPETIATLRQQVAEECAAIRRTWSNAATLARFLTLDPLVSPLSIALEQLSTAIGEEATRKILAETYLSTMQQDWTLLPIRLPEFRQGYEAGRRYALTEGLLTDVELLDDLKTLVSEGLFEKGQETQLPYHIGQLIGRLSGGVVFNAYDQMEVPVSF
jgi:hypothetical protein